MPRSLLAVALLLTLVARPSAQVVPSEVVTLADASTVVLTGRVESVTAQRDAGAIYSYVRVEISEVLKDDVPGPTVVLKQLGGTLPELGLYIADEASFTVGEDVLLFPTLPDRP